MRKIFLFLVVVILLPITVMSQEWTVTFKYADKLYGYPNRYECHYKDKDTTFELEFRTDKSIVEIRTYQESLQQCDDSVQIVLCSEDGMSINEVLTSYVYFYEGKNVRIRSWNIIDWLRRGGRVKITIYKSSVSYLIFDIYPMRQNDLLNY